MLEHSEPGVVNRQRLTKGGNCFLDAGRVVVRVWHLEKVESLLELVLQHSSDLKADFVLTQPLPFEGSSDGASRLLQLFAACPGFGGTKLLLCVFDEVLYRGCRLARHMVGEDLL